MVFKMVSGWLSVRCDLNMGIIYYKLSCDFVKPDFSVGRHLQISEEQWGDAGGPGGSSIHGLDTQAQGTPGLCTRSGLAETGTGLGALSCALSISDDLWRVGCSCLVSRLF